MREKAYLVTGCLISFVSLVVLLNVISEKCEAVPITNDYALIAISSINETHQTEYEKSVAFYEYLIDEGYSSNNIHYYGPSSITYTDGVANTSNIEDGFEALINSTTNTSDVTIYISDHIQHISQIEFYFNDGIINQTLMDSWLDSMSYSELTFIMNGNRSGLVKEFRQAGRTIISSMSEIDETCPDYFNITRSLENDLADRDWDGDVSYEEAFYFERYILWINQRPQNPQIWID